MKRISCPKIGLRYVEGTPIWVILLKEPNGDIAVGLASAETKELATQMAKTSANDKMEILLVGSLADYLEQFAKRMTTKDQLEQAFGLTEKEK